VPLKSCPILQIHNVVNYSRLSGRKLRLSGGKVGLSATRLSGEK